jgi:hypothetical protein
MTKKKNKYDLTLDEKIDMVRMSVRAVTRGFKTSRLISGVAGIGKSHAVREELEAEKEITGIQYEEITGGIKDAVSFYTMLNDYNDDNLVLMLDDVNTIFTNKDCREILRKATENIPERVITYQKNQIVKGKTFYRNKMVFKSRLVIVTNIPKTKIKRIDQGILSRTSPIEIIATIPEIYEWVGANLKEAPPHNVDVNWKKEVYNFIKDEIGVDNLKQFDFRIFEDAMLWYASNVKKSKETDERGDRKIIVNDQWKSLVYNQCT